MDEFLKFSIVIPAHNEEKYIGETLKRVVNVSYPKEKFEVVVVENGSTDKTLLEAKKIKSSLVKIYSLKRRGISLSKNYGARKAKKSSDWLIFLDADTLLDKNTLREINDYILSHKEKNPVIGTTTVLPSEFHWNINFWFWFYKWVGIIFKASMCLQIARKDIFDKIKYDENLKLLEDYQLIHSMLPYGTFFHMATNKVRTSIRRFSRVGGLKLGFQWMFASSIIPYNLRKKRDYAVVR